MDFNVPMPSSRFHDRRAWVVFTHENDLVICRLLKKNYRHCYVLIHDGRHWLAIDAMAHQMEVGAFYHLPVDFDLPAWLSARGNVVLPALVLPAPKKAAPVALFSCVETAKRILGIHKFWLFTPWQLARHLIRQQSQQLLH